MSLNTKRKEIYTSKREISSQHYTCLIYLFKNLISNKTISLRLIVKKYNYLFIDFSYVFIGVQNNT
jgi:hypothetical protein